MKALVFRRAEARYAAAAITSRLRPGAGAAVGPLKLADVAEPSLPGEGWETITSELSGICGSDLATVNGRSSRYFEPWVSFPFVPGHEVMGRRADGTRVVIEPVLGPEARGFDAPFPGAAPGDADDYSYAIHGDVAAGIQIGYCCDTGGGWGQKLVAHQSQLHVVPDKLSDTEAVMIEPTAVGVHAALKANVAPGATVAVIGAGTQGLVAIAALRRFTPVERIVVAAKYPHQKKLATELGADVVAEPSELARAVRRMTGSFAIGSELSGGADAVIDAAGNQASLTTAIGVARPRGRVVLVGMPGAVSIDMTPLWHRETELVGAYTYGTETLPDGTKARTFALATELVVDADLGRLVTDTYRIEDYVAALDVAANAGRQESVKVCFDHR